MRMLRDGSDGMRVRMGRDDDDSSGMKTEGMRMLRDGIDRIRVREFAHINQFVLLIIVANLAILWHCFMFLADIGIFFITQICGHKFNEYFDVIRM